MMLRWYSDDCLMIFKWYLDDVLDETFIEKANKNLFTHFTQLFLVKTAIISSDTSSNHLTGDGHPEQPKRVTVIHEKLKKNKIIPNLYHNPIVIRTAHKIQTAKRR